MTQSLSNCHRCGSANEAGDLRCPVCYLAVPEVANEADALTRVRVFRCPSCGAAMEYLARVQAPQCAFCGGVLKLEQPVDPMEQTEKSLPFTVDRETAVQAYRRWLSRQGFFRPSNLASAARLESLRALRHRAGPAVVDQDVSHHRLDRCRAGGYGVRPDGSQRLTTLSRSVAPFNQNLNTTPAEARAKSTLREASIRSRSPKSTPPNVRK